MNLYKSLCSILSIIILLPSHIIAEYKPNYQREQNINEQIINYLFDSEVMQLNSELETQFNLIYNSKENEKHSILLLHGRGLNPDEQAVMGPLRIELDKSGYNVFSLQLPVLAKGSSYSDYQKIFKYSNSSITSALKYINTNSLIIVAHSCGSHMLTSWLTENNQDNLLGLVLLGAGAVDKGEIMIDKINYNKLNIPILNVIGENDHGSVMLNNIEFEKYYLNKHHHSKSISIDGSDHNYQDKSDIMIDVVKEWLKSL